MFYKASWYEKPIEWYAQTSSRLFSASVLKNFKTGEIEKAANDEFRSNDYVCTKNLSREGIYRFGVTNGLDSRDKFMDFYIMDEDTEDYHYQTKDVNYCYGISVLFNWIEYNEKTKKNESYSKRFNQFSKCLTLSKAQQKVNEIRFNDIFVQKFGHMDVALGEQKEMSHDGYSVGFQTTMKIDDTKSVNMTVRGNIGLTDTKPFFQINITPNFDCQSVDVELVTNDTEFKKKKLHCLLQQDATTSINIVRDNDDEAKKEATLKSEYRSIARFIDWNAVPKEFQIDWDNDSSDKIGKTFLKWAEYLENHNDEKILETKYFTVVKKPGHPIYYHNDYLSGRIGFEIKFDNEFMTLPITTFPADSYLYTKSDDLLVEGSYHNIEYSLCIISDNKNAPPKVKLEIEPSCESVKGKFRLVSDIAYKDTDWHDFDLAGERLIFETKL